MKAHADLIAKVEEFIGYLAHAKGYSAHTCNHYKRQLERVARSLAEQHLTDWSELSTRAIESLLISWRRQQQGIPSIHQRLAALRSFCEYLIANQILSNNPAKLVKAPKAPQRLPKNMDVDAVSHLLDEVPSEPLEIRDRAMFELIYSSGLRVSELVALNISDLNAERELRVLGKGNRTRIVPYGKEAQRWLEQWLKVRQQLPQHSDTPALFIGQRSDRLTTRSVQLRLKRWAAQRGILDAVHPHKLRHSFASHMLESSGDLRAVQELLGHANLSTTQVYTHLDFQHLAKVYDGAHPRAHKKTK